MINLKAEVSNPMTIGQFSQLGKEMVFLKRVIYLHQISKSNPSLLFESMNSDRPEDRKRLLNVCDREFEGLIKKVNYNSPFELCLFFENIEVTADLIELLNELIQNKLTIEFVEKYFPILHGDLAKSNFKELFEGPRRALSILGRFGFVFRAIAC